MVGNDLFHFLRIGSHAEKEYFLNLPGTYDGIIINANLIEATTAASSSLVAGLKGNYGKEFFVDPYTFAFGLRPSLLWVEKTDRKTKEKTLQLKSTYENLAKSYGTVIQNKVGKIAITPGDFSDSIDREEFCRSVLEYQVNKLSSTFEQDDFFNDFSKIEPLGLISPYFFIPELEEWLDFNIQLIETSYKVNLTSLPLYAVICLDQRLLESKSNMAEVTQKYSKCSASGYFLWVSAMDEKGYGEESLKNFVNLILHLSQTGKKVINMYGGYLSVLLGKVGLSGFTHGVGYGAERDVEPVIGGVPSSKFYFLPLHERFLFSDIYFLVSTTNPELYFETVCDCDTCKSVIGANIQNFAKYGETKPSSKAKLNSRYADREYPTGESVRLCRYHFLMARKKEIEQANSSSLAELLEGLKYSYGKYRNLIGPANVEHFKIWDKVLSDYK